MIRLIKQLEIKKAVSIYFNIIAIVNNIKIGKKELDLLSSIAVEKDFDRDRWIKENKSSYYSYYNMIGRLTKRQFLKKGKVHPSLLVDYSDIKIEVVLNGK